MKNELRKILVRKRAYQWRYVPHVRHLPQHTSRLLIFSSEHPVRIEVFFHTHDTWTGGNPLNEGLPFIKDGKREIVNFNQPKFVAELLVLIIDSHEATQLANLVIENGKTLIDQLGYREVHEEYHDSSFRYFK